MIENSVLCKKKHPVFFLSKNKKNKNKHVIVAKRRQCGSSYHVPNLQSAPREPYLVAPIKYQQCRAELHFFFSPSHLLSSPYSRPPSFPPRHCLHFFWREVLSIFFPCRLAPNCYEITRNVLKKQEIPNVLVQVHSLQQYFP